MHMPVGRPELAMLTVKCWTGGNPGRFNIQPHVMQINPNTAPQMFTVPLSYQLEIPLVHPVHHRFAELDLKVRACSHRAPSPVHG